MLWTELKVGTASPIRSLKSVTLLPPEYPNKAPLPNPYHPPPTSQVFPSQAEAYKTASSWPGMYSDRSVKVPFEDRRASDMWFVGWFSYRVKTPEPIPDSSQ